MAGFVWQSPPSRAFPALAEAYVTRVRAGARAIAQRYKPEIENWMRDNARWTDRTANARQSLHAEVDDLTDSLLELVIAHGMEYGWYLEGINPEGMTPMENAGRYNVIDPAIDVFAPRIWADIQRMLS